MHTCMCLYLHKSVFIPEKNIESPAAEALCNKFDNERLLVFCSLQKMSHDLGNISATRPAAHQLPDCEKGFPETTAAPGFCFISHV